MLQEKNEKEPSRSSDPSGVAGWHNGSGWFSLFPNGDGYSFGPHLLAPTPPDPTRENILTQNTWSVLDEISEDDSEQNKSVTCRKSSRTSRTTEVKAVRSVQSSGKKKGKLQKKARAQGTQHREGRIIMLFIVTGLVWRITGWHVR